MQRAKDLIDAQKITSLHARLALLAFIILFATAFFSVWKLESYAKHNRSLIERNTKAIVKTREKAQIAYARVTAIQEARRVVAVAYARSDLRLCKQIEILKFTISRVVRENAPNAKIVYYQEHPKELAAARRRTLKVLHRFAPRKCTFLPSVQNKDKIGKAK